MSYLYTLAVLGSPSDSQVSELKQHISQAIAPSELRLGQEIEWIVSPSTFTPRQRSACAAVFFGKEDACQDNLKTLTQKSIPILPVVSNLAKVQEEIPPILHSLNCLSYEEGGSLRVATALLECVGLLPRQRRVFLSYRRNESRQAAIQLFDELSSRLFDVFLDTHDISLAEEFQVMLWHRLCESDVVLMLDTPTYFESRWTSAEFGRALAKSIPVLQIVWPDATPSKRTATASRIELSSVDIDSITGRLTDGTVARICSKLETVRSLGYAARHSNLFSKLRADIKTIGGSITGVGAHKAIYFRLANGNNVIAYPTVGIPNSVTLHNATKSSPGRSVAVIFDTVGLHSDSVEHLEWLEANIDAAHCVKTHEAAWRFADWEV